MSDVPPALLRCADLLKPPLPQALHLRMRMRHDDAPIPDPPPLRPATRAAWAISFSVVLLAYTVPLGGDVTTTPSPNELSRILLATSIAVNGTFVVDGAVQVYGSMEDVAERDGRFYSEKAPGLAFLAVPVVLGARTVLPAAEPGSRFPDYWPLRHALTWALVTLPGALFPFLILRRETGVDPRRRPLVAMIIALTTPLFTYATVFYGHLPAGLLAAAAWGIALRSGEEGAGPDVRAAALSGFLAAFAAATEYPTAILGAVLLGTLIYHRPGRSVVAGFSAGAVLGLLPLLLYHHFAFGSAWTTGYAFEAVPRYAALHARGFFGVTRPTLESLWGILGSARRGILFYSPILLLAPAGLVVMGRRRRRETWPLVLAAGGYIFFAAAFLDWKGGWSASARHLIPLVALLVIPVSHAIEAMLLASWSSAILAALVAVSLGNAILSLAVSPFFPVIFEAPLMQVAVRCLMEGAIMRTFVSDLTPIPAPLAVAAWAALVLAAVTAALALLRPGARWRAWAAVILVATIFASVKVQWGCRPIRTVEQERVRAYMLERLGYADLGMELWRVNAGARDPGAPIPE